MTETLYTLLEADTRASPTSLKKHFLLKARLFHPDKFVLESETAKQEATDRFNAVKEAYEVLCDHELRAIYDQHVIEKGHESAYSEMDMARQARVYYQHVRNTESAEPISSSPNISRLPKKRGRPPGAQTASKVQKKAAENFIHSSTDTPSAAADSPVDENPWTRFTLSQRREFYSFALDHYIPRDCPHRVQHLAPSDFREVPQAAFDAYSLRFFRGILNPQEVPPEDRATYLTDHAQETFKHRYGTLVLLDVALNDARKIGAQTFHKKLRLAARSEPPHFMTDGGWVFGPEEELRLLELTSTRFGISECVNRAVNDETLWPKSCQLRKAAFRNFLDARLRWMITALVAISSGGVQQQHPTNIVD